MTHLDDHFGLYLFFMTVLRDLTKLFQLQRMLCYIMSRAWAWTVEETQGGGEEGKRAVQ